MSKKLSLKGSGVSWNEFSCEIVHIGKSLISVFQKLSAGINKTFILAERLGTRLSFYEF